VASAAVIGATVALIAGFFVGGPLGLFLGPFVGTVALELLSGAPDGKHCAVAWAWRSVSCWAV
jgi:uncharacterized protein YqgC (DUF456 family)